MTSINFQILIRAYLKRDFKFITEFIKNSPQNANTESSLAMMTSGDPFYSICSLNAMSSAYAQGGNYNHALLYGLATYECVYHYLFKSAERRKEEVLYFAASSANFITKSYLDSARYSEGIEFYDRTVKDFQKHFNKPEFISAQLNAVELYLAIDNPETARSIFQSLSPGNIPYYSRINYERLGTKIKALFREISVTSEEAKKSETEEQQAELKNMIDAIGEMFTQTSEGETQQSNEISQMINQLRPLIGNTGNNNEQFNNATSIYRKFNNYFKTVSEEKEEYNIMDLRLKLYDLQGVFLNDSTKSNPDVLKNTLHDLQQLLPKFRSKYIDESNDTLWSIHICQKRLRLSAEGADTLEELRVNLEHKRASIYNKKERAGVFKTFEYLFPSLIELYHRSGNERGVLKAIEASKGRLLADAIAEQSDTEMEVANYELPVEKLPSLLLKNHASYLSFFLYDDYSISVLLTSNGKIYVERTPDVDKTVMKKWVDDHLDDPKEWNSKSTKGFFTKKINIPENLGKLLNVLKRALEEGNLNLGDHLIYSPHEVLFLFPLQYALFNNSYLIQQFSLSRIHGAYQLISLLEHSPVLPTKIICCTVPAVQDLDNSEKIQQFSEVKQWLSKNYSSFDGVSEADSLDKFSRNDYINSLIHFSTHGVFPSPGTDPAKANPFYNSGLLLKDGEKLPALDPKFNYFEKSYFLNSCKLFDADKSWKNSHVTFQACVSARSKEGVGGDALGMENAAFFLGARSMLTAGWNISIVWANNFCIRFYHYWLKEKLTKAAAYKKAMLEIMSEVPFQNHGPYYWAGMILSGDWR
ncbi:CHAT domain-containing protein [Ilyomonas limi]|uniref:CHAT domain-containing protein n=1 Tax=Ilyomonas limi TaxID=2575867 RepID=A0A4U3KYZ8_9BACT|nr:CHAT domain-containing protein [Ilyomonas limi]TKK67642.1 CHAT domain-containing protein [Ilyomonas limi]